MIEDALRATIDRVAPLRRVVKSRPGQQLVGTARAMLLVRERARFLARQLGPSGMGPAGVACYRLRGSRVRVCVRHENVLAAARRPGLWIGDVYVLNEIFGRTGGHNAYDPPAPFAAILDRLRAPKILDLGGNIGLFAAYALARWPDASVHSIEADPSNMRVLERAIEVNGLGERWSATRAAAAASTGTMAFVAGLHGESHLLVGSGADGTGAMPAGGPSAAAALDRDEDATTIAVPAIDVFEQDHDVALLKIDIEGGEWAILCDERLPTLRARVIVLEWHDRGCPDADARTCAARTLRAAGYELQEDTEIATHNGVMWAARPPALVA